MIHSVFPVIASGGAGTRLSVQAHRRRAEHRVVVRGSAQVTRDAETFVVAENQSTCIPRGAGHRLENPGPAPLELVEVRSGSYLEEDDNLRFDDACARADPQPGSGSATPPGMNASSPSSIVPIRRPGMREPMRRHERAGGTARGHRARRRCAFDIDC